LEAAEIREKFSSGKADDRKRRNLSGKGNVSGKSWLASTNEGRIDERWDLRARGEKLGEG